MRAPRTCWKKIYKNSNKGIETRQWPWWSNMAGTPPWLVPESATQSPCLIEGLVGPCPAAQDQSSAPGCCPQSPPRKWRKWLINCQKRMCAIQISIAFYSKYHVIYSKYHVTINIYQESTIWLWEKSTAMLLVHGPFRGSRMSDPVRHRTGKIHHF